MPANEDPSVDRAVAGAELPAHRVAHSDAEFGELARKIAWQGQVRDLGGRGRRHQQAQDEHESAHADCIATAIGGAQSPTCKAVSSGLAASAGDPPWKT